MCREGIVVLAGGVGAARFLTGLAGVAAPESITAIVNTGDDEEFHGLYVCPDIDIVTYTLAGIVDPDQGWGIRGDSFACLSLLGKLGEPTWFNLGDQDFAVHIHRTHRRRQGWTLDRITEEIRTSFGIRERIVPMTNDRVATKVDTGAGLLPFQEYFVKRKTRDRVSGIVFEGIDESRPAPGVIESIMRAGVLVIAPSNPFVSIGPILSVPGIRDAVRSTDAAVAAISPIVHGAAIKGPAASMMADLHHEVSPLGIARLYRDVVDTMIIDLQDAHLKGAIEDLGMRAVVADTIMDSRERKMGLAASVVDAAGLSRWSQPPSP
jgi:LPPG:FO 2-phospho-L-lactate transferase